MPWRSSRRNCARFATVSRSYPRFADKLRTKPALLPCKHLVMSSNPLQTECNML
nr:MAG TPA: hypothetical protein [Caudoviricetes sp.]